MHITPTTQKAVSQLFKLLIIIGVICFAGISYSLNATASMRGEVYRFRECKYWPENCECCQKVDAVFQIYKKAFSDLKNQYEQPRIFIGSGVGPDHRFVALIKHPKFHSTGGFKTIIVKKINNEWKKIFSIHSTGIVYADIYGQFCFQTHKGAELFTRTGDTYLMKEIYPHERCGGVKKEDSDFYFPRFSK